MSFLYQTVNALFHSTHFRRSLSAIAISLSCLATTPILAQPAETIANSRVPGVAPPACDGEAQLALNRCAGQWARTADFLRSLIYEDLYWQLSESLQSQLVTTEQSWNSFRDNHCIHLSAPFREGSIYTLLYNSCRARVTNDRIADLQALGEPDLETEDVAIRLKQLLEELDLQDSLVQRQWIRYQTAHCQFEVERLKAQEISDKPEQAERCRQRLSVRRIRQLEDMNRIR